MDKSTTIKSTGFALLMLALGFALYGSAGHDDSHITFWASYTLSEFGEILNYNGDRVEQSSSLLLTVLIAITSRILFIDVVLAGYLITIASGVLSVFFTAHLCQRINPLITTPSLMLLISSPAFLLWNFSGMESTLAATCLIGFILTWGDYLNNTPASNTSSPNKKLTLSLLATLCLLSVRPEMSVFIASLVFAVFFWRKISRSQSSTSILMFYITITLSIISLLLFRYFYFGQLFPQPVYAKNSGLSTQKLIQSLFYFIISSAHNITAFIAILISVIYLLRFLIKPSKILSPLQPVQFHLLLSLFSVSSYGSFIFLSGGDWMQAARFFVPILPLCCIICCWFLWGNSKYICNRQIYRHIIIIIIISLNINSNIFSLKKQSSGTPLWANIHISPTHQQRYSIFEQYNQEHIRDMDVIDTLDNTIQTLLNHEIYPVKLMSGQAGMVFFYTAKKYFGEVQFYDNHALTEAGLLNCSLVNHVNRSNQGLFFSFDAFFALQPQLQNECSIPEPDILYGINDLTRKLPQRMELFSYQLIHKEKGQMLVNNTALPIKLLASPNFIMIKNNLISSLDKRQLNLINYREKPLVSRWPL